MRLLLTLLCLLPLCGFAQGFSDASAPYLLSSSSLRKGLVGYWRLEEGSGTRYDCSPYGNHLTPGNNVGAVIARVGNGFNSMGITNYLTCTDTASLRMGNSDYTICFWVQFYNIANFGFLVAKDDSGTAGRRDYAIYYRTTSTKLTYVAFKATDSTVLVESITPSLNTWYFVACWHDATAGTINMQVNNGTVYSTATSGALQAAGAAPFYLARQQSANGNGLYGILDEVGMWKRVLTAAELTQIYKGVTFPRFQPVTPGHKGWIRLADMPEAKEQHGCEAFNGLIYVAGGASLPVTITNTVFAYNPTTDTWAAKASLPQAVQSPVLRAANGKLYCIGGKVSAFPSDVCTNTVYEYDDSLNSWSTKTPMPIGVEDMSSCVISNKIYINGGFENITTYPIPAIIQVYDTALDSWTTNYASNPLPEAAGDSGVEYGNEFYVIGSNYDGSFYPNLRTTTALNKYTPGTDSWTGLAAGLEGTAYKEVAAIGSKLYAMGGAVVNNSTGISLVQEYDTVANTWRYRTPLPNTVYGASTAALGSSIYVSGGNIEGGDDIKQFWRYDPAGDP